ncbi:MAG: tetratricopeptide repeat protein, partial [Roseimicrobium sp.]
MISHATSPSRRSLACLVWLASALLLCLAQARAQDAKAWSEKETRLASEYLNLLSEKPEPGRVLDLLWELYDKRGQSGFLIDSIAAQAQKQPHPHVLLIHAHLLRKAGRTAEARSRYEEALGLETRNTIALACLVELAEQEGQHEQALALLQRLLSATAAEDPQRAGLLLQQGRLALAAAKPDQAAAAWEEAAKTRAHDAAFVSQIAQHLLGAGFLDKALLLYQQLAQSTDPARKLDALFDLSRLQEQADRFEDATKALREGLALLHFKDWRYAQFFQRLVRLHERFGHLDALQASLAQRASAAEADEHALADAARFASLTVETDDQVRWLRELVKRFPEASDYRWELVRALLDHEGAAEAAKLLDVALPELKGEVTPLVLLRCEA